MLGCTSLENDCRRFPTQRARNSRWRRRWPRWKENGSMWVLHILDRFPGYRIAFIVIGNIGWYLLIMDGFWMVLEHGVLTGEGNGQDEKGQETSESLISIFSFVPEESHNQSTNQHWISMGRCQQIHLMWRDIYLALQICFNLYLVWRPHISGVERERYVADDCSGKGFYCGHFLLQRSHTVLPLSLSASPLPHSAKISAPPIGQKILILNPPFISAPTKCAFWSSIFTPLKPFPTLSF